jgi:hypothetical protein
LWDDTDVRALAGVIRNLSDFAAAGLQLGSGKRSNVVDLSVVMDQVHVTIEPMLEQAGLHLEWRISDRLPLVYADQGSLTPGFPESGDE